MCCDYIQREFRPNDDTNAIAYICNLWSSDIEYSLHFSLQQHKLEYIVYCTTFFHCGSQCWINESISQNALGLNSLVPSLAVITPMGSDK